MWISSATLALILVDGREEIKLSFAALHSNNQKAAELCRAGSDGGSCTDVRELDRHEQLVSAGQRDRSIGFIALGVGGAALVTTAVLLLTGQAQPQPADAPEISLGLSDGAWGATLSGWF